MNLSCLISSLSNRTFQDKKYGVDYKGGKLLRCNNKGITECKILQSTNEICDEAFFDCTNLRYITIPNRVEVIGGKAFFNCHELRESFITHGWDEMTHFSFNGDKKPIFLTIPDSVTTIKDYAFCNCIGLEGVKFGKNMTEIAMGVFQGCTSLISLDINLGVTTIGQCAFQGCTGLTMIIIPDNVTSINQSAFYGCSKLTHLAIGKGMSSIEGEAFAGCKKLREIVSLSSTPPTCAPDAFDGVPTNNCVLFVPYGTRNDYQNDPVWGSFGYIFEF